ncbi:MAG: preprotein translocase subunit YajC [Actinomyces sp.]|uniref:preprotein translocase subunit YajC n=1 Tax=Actinomyces sp. TaxID=29317 RepID=UPI0026DB8E03|nr:preprotein translocase subunit YajC [Actinomyces sp.]MDO4244044.1 preprotein translocase subunit YajC [Actinomyces sp.]
MILMIIVMLVAFWLMSRFARKQQTRMLAEQERRTEEALVPGTWVRTRAGFYGTVVEVDGDVVTLATPLGDESLWAKNAILGAEEPPFASVQDEEDGEPSELLEDRQDAEAGDPADGERGSEPADDKA